MDSLRSEILGGVKSIVVKLGTQLLADPQKRLDAVYLGRMAQQVQTLRQRGVQVTIVSSGAVGAGLRQLDLPKRPTDLAALQAVAAVGQPQLMHGWSHAFEPYGLPVAQLLLTREDIEQRTRFLNVRNTINALHALGAVPIINENDTISTDEIIRITFGDNDILAGLVAHATQAHLLVLLSVVDGLLDASGRSVRVVPDLEAAKALVRKEKSSLGKGGMDSKLEAARMVTRCGSPMVVANGRDENVLVRLLSGENIGTLFLPAPQRRSSRVQWIGGLRPRGQVHVDPGAVTALVDKHRSLLPAGIRSVSGEFERGDCVGIIAPDGTLVARGLSNYDSVTLRQVVGRKTADVRALLKEAAYDEAVHRDNLVVG
jgi:glutamate 5-kinase